MAAIQRTGTISIITRTVYDWQNLAIGHTNIPIGSPSHIIKKEKLT